MSRRVVIAEHLRRYTNISKVKNDKKFERESCDGQTEFEQQKKLFMDYVFEERELRDFQLKIIEAAKEGRYEFEVMEFTSDFCRDGGRAINNNEKDWPKSLQGKAKTFFDLWQQHGQPQGYRLKARVNNYPKGFIGDISLLVDWS